MIDWLTHWVAVHYDPSAFTWRELPGYLGALFIVASFLVRTMIPLRALSAAGNLCIVVYAWLDGQYPVLALKPCPTSTERAADDEACPPRAQRGARRSDDGLAQTVHDPPPLRPRSVPVPQGRRRRRDVLYCIWALSHPRTGT